MSLSFSLYIDYFMYMHNHTQYHVMSYIVTVKLNAQTHNVMHMIIHSHTSLCFKLSCVYVDCSLMCMYFYRELSVPAARVYATVVRVNFK